MTLKVKLTAYIALCLAIVVYGIGSGLTAQTNDSTGKINRLLKNNSTMDEVDLNSKIEKRDGRDKRTATKRSRAVQLDTEAMDEIKSSPSSAERNNSRVSDGTQSANSNQLPSLILDLFDDMVIKIKVDKIEKDGNAIIWTGHVEGETYSEVSIVTIGNVVSANINIPLKGLYEIRPLDNGTHTVSQIDPSKLPKCHQK
jgi:hypothetical protein